MKRKETKGEVALKETTKVCKYCKSEIHKKAKVCPHCRRSQNRVGKWVIIILVVLWIIGSGEEDNPAQKESEAVETTETEASKEETQESVRVIPTTEELPEETPEPTTEAPKETEAETETTEISVTEAELTEKEYKAECQELFYDEIFFGDDDLQGKKVKLHLFLSERSQISADDVFFSSFGEVYESYNLNRSLFKGCVLREGTNSYVGQQINIFFSDNYEWDPLNYETGEKIIVYADVISWSSNTWDGYNSVSIIPRYIEAE